MNRYGCALGAMVLSGLAGPGLASPMITVGTHELAPNQAHQAVDVYVSGGDAVQGLALYVQIGNGTDALAAPTLEQPDISSAGLLFAGNNTGVQRLDDYPHEQAMSTTTLSGSLAASGKLATIYVDTTGFAAGSWALVLGHYSPQQAGEFDKPATSFGLVGATITDGTITIAVPEPGSLGVLSAGVLLLGARRRR